MDKHTFSLSRTVMMVYVLFIAGVAWAATALVVNNRTEQLTLSIDNDADTAKVYKLTTFTARDSFYYSDTIAFKDTTIVTWVSPPMKRRITVTAATAGANVVNDVDTTLIDSIVVDFGTNRVGIGYTVANIAWTGIPQLVDTMVARFNALATAKDTVLAIDSSTYIILKSKIWQDSLEGAARWTIKAYPTGTFDEADSSFTTINMVCDSMVAAINGTAALADSVTAAVMGAAGGAADTAYKVTGRKGYDFLLSPNDTAQDTVIVTAAVAGINSVTNTFALERVAGDDRSFTSVYMRAILNLSDDTTHGIGDSSIGYLYLYHGINGRLMLMAGSDSSEMPCTLQYAYPDQAGADTVFKQALYLVAKVTDTFSDTSWYMIEYDIDLDYTLKGSR